VDYSSFKKISVIGNSAAGKSTLSIEVGKNLGLDVFSIDKAFWLPEWALRDEASFKNIHNKWLSFDSWIIDGVGYWGSLVDRISKSDLVIFLDVPVSLCKDRANKRIMEEKYFPNPNITEGCIYADVKNRQMEVIDNFHIEIRPKILDLLSSLSEERIKIVGGFEEMDM